MATYYDTTEYRAYIRNSSAQRALDVAGDRWSFLIILGAFYGYSRFEDWKSHYNMSTSVLSSRLKKLQANGILVKTPLAGSRHMQYLLTPTGKDLLTWALAVWEWENEWLYRYEGHRVHIVHADCGQSTFPQTTCMACGESIQWMDVDFEEGPGYVSMESVVPASTRRSTVSTGDGPVGSNFGRFADIFGDRWSYQIVSAALFRVRRFDELMAELNIGSSILAERLKHLVHYGLLARSRYQDSPARWEYIATQKTMDFAKIPLMLGIWADKHLPPSAGPVYLRRHRLCKQVLNIEVGCHECGGSLDAGNITFQDSRLTHRT